MLEYKNKKNQIYYLHKKITKRGNFRYYFSKSCNDNLVDKIPDGYEIYENPSGQVFLRKLNISSITENETFIVENFLHKKTKFENYYLDVHGNEITVFLPKLDIEEIDGMLSITMIGENIELSEFYAENFIYIPSLKVTINNDEGKKYFLEKYKVDAEIKKWIPIDSSTDLNKLLEDNINEFSDNSNSKLNILFS